MNFYLIQNGSGIEEFGIDDGLKQTVYKTAFKAAKDVNFLCKNFGLDEFDYEDMLDFLDERELGQIYLFLKNRRSKFKRVPKYLISEIIGTADEASVELWARLQ